MESERENAYRFVLAAGLLHLKWDLAGLYGGFAWLNPFRLRHQFRASLRAAFRAAAFHNLAIFSTKGFKGFSEELFWDEIERFRTKYPDGDWADYRRVFDRMLRTGESITGGLSQFSSDENGTVPLRSATVISSPVLRGEEVEVIAPPPRR